MNNFYNISHISRLKFSSIKLLRSIYLFTSQSSLYCMALYASPHN